jgi:hypothetical protein
MQVKLWSGSFCRIDGAIASRGHSHTGALAETDSHNVLVRGPAQRLDLGLAMCKYTLTKNLDQIRTANVEGILPK